VGSGVCVVAYQADDQRLPHPAYMEALGVAAQMRFPGLSKDPLNAFRRLRTDLVRFAGPFLTGKGLAEFASLAKRAAADQAQAPRPAAIPARGTPRAPKPSAAGDSSGTRRRKDRGL